MDKNLIVVGSGGLALSGEDIQPNDIDIVINDTTDLERFLDINLRRSNGVYTTSGIRGYTTYKGYLIDIFVNELVTDIKEVVIDGIKIKYQTRKGMEEYLWRMIKYHRKDRGNKRFVKDKLNSMSRGINILNKK